MLRKRAADGDVKMQITVEERLKEAYEY